jgi:tetratricopeptide (TPR) repeat protein
MSRGHTLRRAALALALLGGLCVPAVAQTPDTGLEAEMRNDWPAAASIYRAMLQQPERSDDASLWTRLGEVEARAGNAEAAAAAYARAADLSPGDADAQRDASRAYATAQLPAPALVYLEQAIALRPDDDALKIDRVRLANWLGDYALAERTLDELLAENPGRADISADLGRVRAWQGRLGEADDLFEAHLESFPDDRLAWIDRARIAIWNGDYARAVDLLDAHDRQFLQPPDDKTQVERARALAWSGRWREALALNAELRADGESYDELFTETLLHRHHYRPVEALPWLDRVLALKPDAQETRDLERGTRLPLRSRIGADISRFSDSEDIEIDTLGARGAWRVGDATWLRAELQQRDFSAPAAGPFGPIGGGNSIDEDRVMLGLDHAPSESTRIALRLGQSDVQGVGSDTIGRLDLDWQANDTWRVGLDAGRDRLAASPRSISLDIDRRWLGADVEWRPNLRWRALARLERTDLSDDNDALQLDASVWRSVYNSQTWQWDLGGVANWQSFDDPAVGRGYYAPDRYRRVQAAARAYWRWNDDNGMALDVATGVQRDENSDSWKSASDVSVEMVFGIFSDWELRLRGAYSDRRQAAGTFDGRSFGASLEYRF